MDGYALRTRALAAGVAQFRVRAVQAAGAPPQALGPAPDDCVEIMTGAVLPGGADAVVPYEDTARTDDTVTTAAGKSFLAGHAVHRQGSDHRAGEVVVPAGARLTARAIAVAAACGRGKLAVSARPRIAVVATGDELVEVDAAPEAHQLRRSNDYALRAALLLAGFPQVERFLLRDAREEIAPALERLLAEFDVLILTGGVSQGRFDLLPSELERQGVTKVFHGVAQRPGKPFWFGVSTRGKPIFALPGNPVSSHVCLHRYVLPALARAAGLAASPPPRVALAAPVNFAPRLAWFLPVVLAADSDGIPRARPAPANTSGDLSGLVGTDGFVELPAEIRDFPAGTAAPFWAW